ncbi:MAG: methyltransferase domain-containing protein [Alphaproteobacteria bacterium]|nr:methyltransferase domain-containing protein [Alphaproteobacteria bacterium]
MSFVSDQFRFLRALAARPKNVGAVAPSGPQLAKAMAAQIRLDLVEKGGSVLELGPGTGAITGALVARVGAERLTAVEYDGDFSAGLKARWPAMRVIEGDAFDLDRTLGHREPYAAIVSGLPLLNFPMEMRHRLLDGVAARLMPGASFIQFSYGLHAPVTPPDGHIVAQAAFCWANMPPARVWVYRKA